MRPAISGCGCRSARCHDRVVTRNRFRRQLRSSRVLRSPAGGRRGPGDATAATGSFDRRLSVRPGRRRTRRSDRRRRRLDRRRGGGGVGAGPSRSRRSRPGRAAALDRGTRLSARRARGALFGIPVAYRGFGGDDLTDEGVQPVLVGRGADPIVAGSVAAVARRNGGSGGLHRTELRRPDPAGRAPGGSCRRR